MTLLLNAGYQKWSNRTRILTYSVSPSTLLQKPDLGSKRINITVDDKPIESLSAVTVYITNSTDQDYEDVVLSVEFQSDGGEEPKLLDPVTKRATQEYEVLGTEETGNNNIRFVYKVRVFNRGRQARFDYKFEGPSPKATVKVNKKGLEAEYKEIGNVEERPVYVDLGLLVSAMLLLFPFIYGKMIRPKDGRKPYTLTLIESMLCMGLMIIVILGTNYVATLFFVGR